MLKYWTATVSLHGRGGDTINPFFRFALAFLLCGSVLPQQTIAQEQQWWHVMIGARGGVGDGLGVTVGVLDGAAFGVNAGGDITFIHPEFEARLAAMGYPTGPGDWSNYNVNGDFHGTHVAGIIGAARDGIGMRGVAPRVDLVSVAVFDDGGWAGGAGATTSGALARSYDEGASIANASYGYPNGDIWDADDIDGIVAHREKLFISYAAGNDGVNLISKVTPRMPANLIIVGAVDLNKRIAFFSNRPGTGCFRRASGDPCRNVSKSDKYMYRFLVAPGVGILSTDADGGYVNLSGTSMAAPMVAGAAALLQSRWPFLKTDPRRTANILLSTAQDLGAKGVDKVYGRGLLRIDRAMRAQGQTKLAVGQTVDGPVASEASMALPAGLGNSTALKNALEGLVVFDKFDRDFKLSDPGAFVHSAKSTYSLTNHFKNRFRMADRGALVSMQAGDGLSFVGVVPDRPDEGSGELALLQRDAQRSSMAAYMDYLQDDHDVWQLDGELNSFSFSFGQRTGLARDISFGSPNHLYLFDSEVAAQPLMKMGEQNLFAYGRYAVTKEFGIAMGFAETSLETGMLNVPGTGSAYLMQADYKPLSWLGLQLTQSYLSEDDTVLGSLSLGALALGSGASTFASGAVVSIDILPSTTARLHFTESVTETDAASGSLFRGVDSLQSHSYGLSLIHTGIFGQSDQFGISVSRPLQVHAGDAVLETPIGRTIDGDVIYKKNVISMMPEGTQTDVDLGYRAALNSKLSLGVNLYYQDDADNNPDAWNAGVLGRVRLLLQ